MKIPLLTVSTDRPLEWIDKMDGHTIRKSGFDLIFLKESYYSLVEAENKDNKLYLKGLNNLNNLNDNL